MIKMIKALHWVGPLKYLLAVDAVAMRSNSIQITVSLHDGARVVGTTSWGEQPTASTKSVINDIVAVANDMIEAGRARDAGMWLEGRP